MTSYTWLWIGWLVLFFAIEGPALANKKPGDTLSEHVWQWFGVKGQGRFVRVRRLFLLVLMCWLSVHFLTGGFI